MTFLMGWVRFVSNRKSRLVTMPTILSFSTTGRPEILFFRVICMTSSTDILGSMVIGSLTTPDSNRLTLSTRFACLWGVKFLWIMPMPPCSASAIAMLASVTVSIAAEITGILRLIFLVNFVSNETSFGSTLE